MDVGYVDRIALFELVTAERRNRTGELERDLRERLTRHVPNDRFEEDIEFTIISARKRTMSK